MVDIREFFGVGGVKSAIEQHYEKLFESDEIINVRCEKLWGIRCTVIINEKILSIHSNTFYEDKDCCRNIRLFKQKVNSFDEAKVILKNIKLDNYVGKFVLQNNNKRIDDLNYWSDTFKDASHISFVGEECCICLQKFTSTETKCGHTLCLQCADQIIKAINDDDDTEIIPCPLCRCDITLGCNFG